MDTGLTAVPAKVRGHRRTQHALVGGDRRTIRNRRSSHNLRCVTVGKTTNAFNAADECTISLIKANSQDLSRIYGRVGHSSFTQLSQDRKRRIIA